MFRYLFVFLDIKRNQCINLRNAFCTKSLTDNLRFRSLTTMDDSYKNVRVPGPNDNVYKDECLYSFDNPESETGLYICMSSFRGVGKNHLDRHCRANPGRNVFLHILRRRIPVRSIIIIITLILNPPSLIFHGNDRYRWIRIVNQQK